MDLMPTEAARDSSEVLSVVMAVVAKVLDRDLPADTQPAQRLDDLGLDSTRVLELLMDLEDSLQVEFDIDTLEQHNVETIGSVADYVLETMAGTAP
jgi:acyl carrier protein